MVRRIVADGPRAVRRCRFAAARLVAMSVELRIALVGCGRWGRHILRDLRSLGCEVPVVARSEESRARASEGGAEHIVSDVDELPEVAGAVVATPTTTHVQVAERLLPRDIPLFVEKPLGHDSAAVERLATAAADRLFVMDKWRYHPGVELLRDLAASGELGDVVGLRTVRVGWGNPHDDTDGIWHLLPHDLSIALEILGDVPTPRLAVADFADGIPAGVVAALGVTPWVVTEVSTRSHARRREVALRGTDGVAVLPDGYADHLLVGRGVGSGDREPDLEPRPVSTELPLLRELRAFVEHVRGGPPPRSSAPEGLGIVKAIARVRELAGLDGAR